MGWYQPSDLSPKMSIFCNTGLVSTQWFKPKNVNILKHWVGINPVILAQKKQFFETLWLVSTQWFKLKKIYFLKHWVGITPVI